MFDKNLERTEANIEKSNFDSDALESYPSFEEINQFLSEGTSENDVNSEKVDQNSPSLYPKEKLGSLDYYQFRNQDFMDRNPGIEPPDYYLNYGDKYLKRFTSETKSKLSLEGQEFLEGVGEGLQAEIEKKIASDPQGFAELERNSDAFREWAYDTHSTVYAREGFRDLPLLDKFHIGATPDAEDILSESGIKEGLETLFEEVPKEKVNEEEVSKEKVKVVYFTGFSGKISESSDNVAGMKELDNYLEDSFAKNSNIQYDGQVYSHLEVNKAVKDIQCSDYDKLVVVGHSFGADSAVEFAEKYEEKVDFLVQVDSVGIGDGKLPDNVNSGVNYFQKGDKDWLVQGKVEGSLNVNLEQKYGVELSHTEIDNYEKLHEEIGDRIERLVSDKKLEVDYDTDSDSDGGDGGDGGGDGGGE